uniref:Sugar phosphate transporter domain-containing protein n=1 Tax=Chromera velia CCMP2878 TaxID=1169474 RepID=A0A0G4F3C4_9ALVE|mmetsp:Transcript_3122/g.6432  ORF Transcript_3122/g.6432 Transcript_3122/m.6432 type:complete len:335 (+) Transcript_3122:97-1101(+)|eukprot:Cvel_14977.t1-p1 / transcript=Cvel_14977.t1 / gene=Cvel_14977 / organism=Chromera_velia_CCMP2878 / gene_product=Triose phosphate/phosphate translocator,, putative / transcript_product=Triose phosphate/phosphate translocator,, putative / location=Cvel_scaffold1088:50195-52921(-) / protein_length=334 / sequence_SO=supercontig / SO=protein_coding / is_pseudo=false
MASQGQQYGTFKGEASKASHGEAGNSMADNGITAALILAWYALNALYNVDNKKALNIANLPYSISIIQLFVGWLWFLPLWGTGLRQAPKLYTSSTFWTRIVPQGICHLLVHLGAVVAMGMGAVSFVQIVKAMEPAFMAALSAAVLGQYFSVWTYLALVPVIGGICLASASELSFTWIAFWGANVSNMGSALRAIYAKMVMKDPKQLGENLTPANMYSMLTIVSTIACIPCALIMEFSSFGPAISAAKEDKTTWEILYPMVMSGIWYYSYNEVAYVALGRVHQVTHAVANTIKRVVIIGVTIIVFQNPVDTKGYIGSAIAILGTLLYSLSKLHFG